MTLCTFSGQRTTTWEPGPQLYRRPTVWLEHWAVDAIGSAFADRNDMRPWLRPRLVAYCRVRDTTVIFPGHPPQSITANQAELLARCDGKRPASEVASQLVAGWAYATRDEVFADLAAFAERRWLVWRLELPVDRHPERSLAEWISTIGDAELAEETRRDVGELVSARDDLLRAVGSWKDVLRASKAADAMFSRITGKPATRNAGSTYAGRTIAYLETERSGRLELGRDLEEGLEPIHLVLQSARWMTYQTRVQLGPYLSGLLADLGGGSDRANLSDYWFEALPIVHRVGAHLVGAIAAEMQQRWYRILAVDVGRTRQAFTRGRW